MITFVPVGWPKTGIQWTGIVAGSGTLWENRDKFSSGLSARRLINVVAVTKGWF